jgi:leader peptidase (prepilin peptidase) / N-methyltransferase
MIQTLGTIFAGLLGLAFGSFLNVCLSRWPQGESIVQPRSHCRQCSHTLTWWENVPLLSWLVLGGRCRKCRAWIGWRYPLVELAVGALWAVSVWQIANWIQISFPPDFLFCLDLTNLGGNMILCWLLVGLAVLDIENLWIPDWVTLPGIILGITYNAAIALIRIHFVSRYRSVLPGDATIYFLGILAAAGLILLIRWIYWLVRRREGIGLGDAKLMALLAAWLGLPQAFLAFGLGVVLGALIGVVLLAVPSARNSSEGWAFSKLPLGTFLCVGGIVSSLWGQPILAAYLHWAGF